MMLNLGTVLGTVIGGIIGFISSYLMWKFQLKHNERNIAQGFFTEISSLERKIELYAKAFTSSGPGTASIKIDQPFYEDGLFLACRKEVFVLNKGLSKIIFEFYTYLLTAEKDRKIDPSNYFFQPANEEMKKSIIDAYNLLPNLKKELKKVIS